MEYWVVDQHEACIAALDEGHTTCAGNYHDAGEKGYYM
jgi:hypothetical protein